MEIQPHLVTVLADTALRGDHLDKAAALKAQQEAEEALNGASGETNLQRAQLELAEAHARYQAERKLKGKRSQKPALLQSVNQSPAGSRTRNSYFLNRLTIASSAAPPTVELATVPIMPPASPMPSSPSS